MITNFEQITDKITAKEIEISKIVMQVLKEHTKPILSEQLMAEVYFNSTLDINLTSARLRTIIHYLRVQELQPIVGTSKGYFLTTDIEQVRKQRRSMIERAQSIMEVAGAFNRIAEQLEQNSHDTRND